MIVTGISGDAGFGLLGLDLGRLGGVAEFGQQLDAACVCGPVKVDVDGLSQSTRNL